MEGLSQRLTARGTSVGSSYWAAPAELRWRSRFDAYRSSLMNALALNHPVTHQGNSGGVPEAMGRNPLLQQSG
jgi:hypothetical protein